MHRRMLPTAPQDAIRPAQRALLAFLPSERGGPEGLLPPPTTAASPLPGPARWPGRRTQGPAPTGCFSPCHFVSNQPAPRCPGSRTRGPCEGQEPPRALSGASALGRDRTRSLGSATVHGWRPRCRKCKFLIKTEPNPLPQPRLSRPDAQTWLLISVIAAALFTEAAELTGVGGLTRR